MKHFDGFPALEYSVLVILGHLLLNNLIRAFEELLIKHFDGIPALEYSVLVLVILGHLLLNLGWLLDR